MVVRDLLLSRDVTMRRSARGRLFAAATLAALLLAPARAALASGVTGSGNPNSCDPTVTGDVGSQTPVPVSETATVHCQPAGAPPGQDTTAPPMPNQTLNLAGQACSYLEKLPVRVEVTTAGDVFEYEPNYDGTYPGGFRWPALVKQIPVMAAEDENIYFPYVFTGKYDQNNRCTVPVGGSIPNAPGWAQGCIAGVVAPIPLTGLSSNVCWVTVPNAITGPPGGIAPPAGPLFNLQQTINQSIAPGNLASMPDNPNPGLVSIGTCFFVQGASVTGANGAPQPITQPSYFQMTVPVPANDGTNRFIFYVIRVKVAYQGTRWDFGDGSTTPDPPPVPGPCSQVQYSEQATHTYHRYGTFQVTATEAYGVTVDEYWDDAAGPHHVTLTNLIAPIARTLGPYAKTILQEEGVPVTGG
jgi:hypothetical protein